MGKRCSRWPVEGHDIHEWVGLSEGVPASKTSFTSHRLVGDERLIDPFNSQFPGPQLTLDYGDNVEVSIYGYLTAHVNIEVLTVHRT